MYIRYSLGFLVASLVQIAIIYVAEIFGFSSLSISSPILQFILQIVLGQIMGYILYFALTSKTEINRPITGILWGILFWAANISINIAFKSLKMPWHQGVATILITLISCIIYGIITTYVITNSNTHVEA